MNRTLIHRAVVVSLFLAVIVVPRGFAQAARVFLSGTGSDAGDCSNAATPCRSLQGAIDQAAPGAEVVVVSSGGYGGATITKSITVNAPTGVIAFVGRTITVTIASTDTVTLRGLSMNGAVFGDADGIAFTAGGALTSRTRSSHRSQLMASMTPHLPPSCGCTTVTSRRTALAFTCWVHLRSSRIRAR